MEEQHQPSQLGNYVIDAPTLHNIGGSVNSCTTGRCILPRITDATSLSRGQPSIDDSSTEEKKSPSIRRSSKLWKRIIVCFINFQIITRPLSRNAILSRAIRFDTRQTVLFVVTLTLEDPVLSYSIFYTLSVKYLFLCDWIDITIEILQVTRHISIYKFSCIITRYLLIKRMKFEKCISIFPSSFITFSFLFKYSKLLNASTSIRNYNYKIFCYFLAWKLRSELDFVCSENIVKSMLARE